MTYLLDTNVISEPTKAVPNTSLTLKLQKHGYECATASTVLHELLYGAAKLPEGKKKRGIERYLVGVLELFPQLPYDARAAEWHAHERARLSKVGAPPNFADSQIAAVAATRNLILVTRNVRDFEQFEGLRIENWFED